MRFESLTQNTPEWEEFRRSHIGASDAPIIMGDSPWKTPYQLWEEKMGYCSGPMSSAQLWGHKTEGAARKWYETTTGMQMRPAVVRHDTLNWMTASLDGLNEEATMAIEIKCPGYQDHGVALNGKIPDKYKAQLQHQLAVTGLPFVHYVSFDGQDGVIVEEKRDESYIEVLLQKEQEFWKRMIGFDPPALEERDFHQRKDLKWESLATQWKVTKKKLTELQEEEQVYRAALIEAADGKNSVGAGIKLTKIRRKGTIDYESIPQLHGVNVELYRKENTTYWKVS